MFHKKSILEILEKFCGTHFFIYVSHKTQILEKVMLTHLHFLLNVSHKTQILEILEFCLTRKLLNVSHKTQILEILEKIMLNIAFLIDVSHKTQILEILEKLSKTYILKKNDGHSKKSWEACGGPCGPVQGPWVRTNVVMCGACSCPCGPVQGPCGDHVVM